jgi:hypothetical protein
MDVARPLRDVFRELASGTGVEGRELASGTGVEGRELASGTGVAGPHDVLRANGHPDLPDGLVAEAVASYADTAAIEVAEHLAPYVMSNSAVPMPVAEVGAGTWLDALATAPAPAAFDVADPAGVLDDVDDIRDVNDVDVVSDVGIRDVDVDFDGDFDVDFGGHGVFGTGGGVPTPADEAFGEVRQDEGVADLDDLATFRLPGPPGVEDRGQDTASHHDAADMADAPDVDDAADVADAGDEDFLP